MLGTRGIHANEREVDLGLSSGGEFDLCLLCGFADMLDNYGVTREIETGVLLELGENVLDEGNVVHRNA
jgi:hypothetical protein